MKELLNVTTPWLVKLNKHKHVFTADSSVSYTFGLLHSNVISPTLRGGKTILKMGQVWHLLLLLLCDNTVLWFISDFIFKITVTKSS